MQNRVYCSKQCQNKGLSEQNKKRINKFCKFCGIAYSVIKCKKNSKFCSRACKDSSQVGQINQGALGRKMSDHEKEMRSYALKKAYQDPAKKARLINALYVAEDRLGHWPGTSSITRLKAIQTYKNKTGFNHPFSNPIIRERCNQTCINEYGMSSDALGRESNLIHSTKPEILLQNWLQLKGITFKSQYSLEGYRFDVCIPSKQLLIEVDGDYWHANPSIFSSVDDRQKRTLENDVKKEKAIKSTNFRLIRIWESEILASNWSKLEKEI